MKKQVTDKKRHTKKNIKQSRFEIRLSLELHKQLADKAKQVGLTKAQFLRVAIVGKAVTSAADQGAAAELRRIGAMLKHLYPKDSNWTASEKRQYWSAMHTLLGVAKNLDGKGFKGDPKNPSQLDRDQSDVS